MRPARYAPDQFGPVSGVRGNTLSAVKMQLVYSYLGAGHSLEHRRAAGQIWEATGSRAFQVKSGDMRKHLSNPLIHEPVGNTYPK